MDLKYLIKQAIESVLIEESKQVGKLYHFTNAYELKQILESNSIKANPLSAINQKIGIKGISTTRLKHGVINKLKSSRDYGQQGFHYGSFRLELDGDLISQRYKIMPIDFGNPDLYNAEELIITDELKNLDRYLVDINVSGRSKKALRDLEWFRI